MKADSGSKWNTIVFSAVAAFAAVLPLRADGSGEDTETTEMSISVSVSVTHSFAYPGSPAMPPVTVTESSSGLSLAEGTDYTVTYTNNTDIGTGKAIVTGKGEYEGLSSTATFPVTVAVPAGMTPLEYVQFSKSTYVNTGIIPTDHQIELTYHQPTYQSGANIIGTGVTSSDHSYMHWTEWTNSGVPGYYWGYNGSQGSIPSGVTQTKHTVVLNRIGDLAVVFDGEVIETGKKSASTQNLFIGRRNSAMGFAGRVYHFRVTDRVTGEVLLDYIPAKNADGVVGFADVATGNFITPVSSAGKTATFTAGPEVSVSPFSVSPVPTQGNFTGAESTPSLVVSNKSTGVELSLGTDYSVSYINNVSNGMAYAVITGNGAYFGMTDAVRFRIYNSIFEKYRPLEYLEAASIGPYIGLDYIHKVNTVVKMVSYVPKARLTNNYHALFGARRGHYKYESFLFFSKFGGAYKGVWCRNAETGGAVNGYPYDEWVELVAGTDSGLVVSWTGEESGKTGSIKSSANVAGTIPFCVFTMNNFNGYGHMYQPDSTTAMRLRSFRIYEGEELVRDFVPARRLSDGKIGLYDPLTDMFYSNRGSGSFTAGRDVSKLKLTADITDQPLYTGGPAVAPAVTVVDYLTGEALTEGVDYTLSYEDNTSLGTGRVVLTGIGSYKGEVSETDFNIFDGGPYTPYPNLSRSYVPEGLVGFWDGIDNTGEGVHDDAAAKWADLSAYGNDGTMNGLATWADGKAMRNDADGLPCTIPLAFSSHLSWHNVTWEFSFTPTELGTTRAVFSNYGGEGGAYGTIVAHNNGTSYADGSIRYFAKNSSATGDQKIASPVKAGQTAYFTILSESRYLTAYRDSDFSKTVYASNPYGYQYTGSSYVIGGRPDQPTWAMRGDIRFVRAYNRILTDEERRFNRALDVVRYENRSLKYILPKKLPRGYEFDEERDVLRVRVSANAIPTKGLVSINGGVPSKRPSMYFDVGEKVTLTYHGEGFLGWTNLPSAYTYPDESSLSNVTFTAGAPVLAMVVSEDHDASTASLITPYSYVQKGLLRLWDGIDNAGIGSHAATNRWSDLTGSGAQWILRNSGSFAANSLTLVASKDSAYTANPVPSYITAEFCANVTAGMNLFSNADDISRIFIFRNDQKVFGAMRYNNERACTYGYSPLAVFNRAQTLSAVYVQPVFSIPRVEYYQDGQIVPWGRSPSSGWGMGDYPALGSRYNYNDNQVAGSIYSIRMYDRELTQEEIALNAALDQIRFFDADEEATLSNLDLPDGYRWNADERSLEVRYDINAHGGTLSIASGQYFKVGESVTIALAPAVEGAPVRWQGLPLKTSVSPDGRSITFTAAAPASIKVSAEQVLPALTYVSDGLVGLWDAKENAGHGKHDNLSFKWYDLTGCNQEPWTLVRGRAAFVDDALQVWGYAGSATAVYQASLIRDWRTIEANLTPVKTNGTVQVLSDRWTTRLLYLDTRPGVNLFGSYKSTSAVCATDPAVRGYSNETYSVTYAQGGSVPSAYYLSGRQITATKTGSYNWNTDNDYPSLGTRYNNCDGRYLGYYHVVRIYDRDLSAVEVAFNAAIDKVRYQGVRLAEVIPETLPDGYRYDSEKGILEVKVGVFTPEGTVRVNGGTETNVYVAVGSKVTFAFTPAENRSIREWHSLPGDAVLSSDALVVTFTAASPVGALVESAPAAPAVSKAMYISDSLIASWDGFADALKPTEWTESSTVDRRGNSIAFDGSNYIYANLPELKDALWNRAATVQLFIRPKRFIWNGGYFQVGSSVNERDLILAMNGERSSVFKAQRGAFGSVQYGANSVINVSYAGIRKDTASYFGKDTLVSVVRDSRGALVAIDDEGFCHTNSAYSGLPVSDRLNVGSWIGARNATFDLYAVRVYNRALTEAELAYNGAVDRARFLGEEVVLPEGYTFTDGKVMVRYNVSVADGSGLVSVNGGEAAQSVEVLVDFNSDLKVDFIPNDGYVIDAWTGVPEYAVYSNVGSSFSLIATGPGAFAATGKTLSYSDGVFKSTASLPQATSCGANSVYSFPVGEMTLTTEKDITIERAIVVGGGGAGGAQYGGGGGGGGVIYLDEPVFVPAGSTLLVSVGAGGAAPTANGGRGGMGGLSSLSFGSFGVEAYGGGGGGGWSAATPTAATDRKIASGGGRTCKNVTANVDGVNYSSSQGHQGGLSINNNTYQYYGAGGGGASTVGESTASSASARIGGNGIAYAIAGSAVVYGSGGGGGGTLGGLGGINAGEGGTGAVLGGDGVDGTGSGGGGGGTAAANFGGKGGDGTVILVIAEGNVADKRLVISFDEEIYSYLGEPVTPEIKVTLGGTLLVKDVDYTVSYADNTSPGYGAVTVAGIAGTAAQGLTASSAFTISKVIHGAFEAAGDADGSSWENVYAAQDALTAAVNTYRTGIWPEVRLKSGDYKLTAALSLSRPCHVRGGYLGAGGVSSELDEENPETFFNGQGLPAKASAVAQGLHISTGFIDCTNYVERCAFGHFSARGIQKSGVASLILRKCRIFNNSWGISRSKHYGRGFHFAGSTASTVVVMDGCMVEGNGELGQLNLDAGYGFGGYASNLKRLYIDNTLFATNGWGGEYRTANGSCMTLANVPLTMRNTKVIGHSLAHPTGGGTVYLSGAGDMSVFTNCLFLGNCNRWYGAFGNGAQSGVLRIGLSNSDQRVEIVNCTFAYNLIGSPREGWSYSDHTSAAGVDITQGKVKIRNSIFWGNVKSSDGVVGADVFVHNGSADIDYTLFGGLTPDYISAFSGADLILGEHIIVGDPVFVTTPDEVKACVHQPANFAIPKSSSTAGNLRYTNRHKLMLFDARVLSVSNNYSRAIDGADPSFPVGAEPLPNGSIANLGYYGTTEEAALTIAGAVIVSNESVTVEFPDGSTMPVVSVAFGGGETPYNARATIYVGSGENTFEWSQDFSGIQIGDKIVSNCQFPFEPGSAVFVKVVVKSPGQDDITITKNIVTEGEKPAWYGHGGDSNKVVHVRLGSTALNPRGTSWADAYPDIVTAAQGLTKTRDEIWVSGETLLTAAPVTLYLDTPAVIRGGFTGTEDSFEDRPEGTYTVLDGDHRFNTFVLANTAQLTIERIRFQNGHGYGLNRTDCSGNLVVEDCVFANNGPTNNVGVAGAAIRFYRSSHPAKTLEVRRCVFEGNGRTFQGNGEISGACIYALNAASLTVEDSVFLTNGAPFSLSTSTTASVRPVGTCILANGTPVTVTRCRFAGNRACSYKTENAGGLIYLLNACNDSVIRNCAFVGNECVTRTAALKDSGTIGGMIVVNLAEVIREVFVENCTFAWNLASGYAIPTDICAYKGIVNVHNSIFYGGIQGLGTLDGTGKYINAAANGTVNVDYSMFDCDLDVAVSNYGGGGVAVDESCMIGDPRFVTSDLGLETRNLTDGVGYAAYAAGMEHIAVTGDVHLVSARGYYDNEGVFHDGGETVSPAIDAGDPEDDCSLEGAPNGGFINLGAYGNTPEASLTYSAKPVILDDLVTISFPDNVSLPKIEFSFAESAITYKGTVKIYFGTEGFEEFSAETKDLPMSSTERFVYQDIANAFVKGTTLYVRVVIESGEHELVVDRTVTVEGEMPAWYGAGGGEGVIHVWADAPGDNDGSSWRDAYHEIESAIDAIDLNTREIWVVGDYILKSKTLTLKPVKDFAIRGGFTGEESLPEERKEGEKSVIDGNNSFNPLYIVNADRVSVTVDSLTLYNGYARGLKKTGGGDLTVMNCSVLTNGFKGTYGDGEGKGILVTSAAGANIFVTNTFFMGNMLQTPSTTKDCAGGHGSGIRLAGCASATIVDCRFYSNGHPNITPNTNHSGNPFAWSYVGGAVYSTVPTEIVGCRFCGNRIINEATTGGIVALRGGAGGSVIRNCLFAANQDTPNSSNDAVSYTAGMIAISLSDSADEVEVSNCTFAYNLCDAKYSAAGITVNKGTAYVKNSIFHGNVIGANSIDKSTDINIREGGRCYVTYSLLSPEGLVREGETATYVDAGGVLEFGDGISYGDPLFVTEIATVTNLIQKFNTTHILFNPSLKPDAVMHNVDAHVLSESGYFKNDGVEYQAEEGVLSPAIDKGDPNDDLGEEYSAPENSVINMGAYGGTRWASKSATGIPEVEGEVTVEFPTEYTQPEVVFTVGGEGTFVASGRVAVSLDGGETWVYESPSLENLAIGQEVRHLVPFVYQPGASIVARVVLEANGVIDEVKSADFPVEGELPPWYGHGGDPDKVVHVRAEAFGSGDGTSWGDAVTSIFDGLRMLTAERNELWLAGTNIAAEAATTFKFDFPIVVRGGFDGSEDALEERKEGVKFLLTTDNYGCRTMLIANAYPAYFERIVFDKGEYNCFKKDTSAGDLTMVDCEFTNGRLKNISNAGYQAGCGGCFLGTSAKTARLALTNCVFRSNKVTSIDGSAGTAARFSNFASVVLSDCLFIENGESYSLNVGGRNTQDSAFYASGCPVYVENTRFIANFMRNGGTGGHIHLAAGTGGSYFRNSQFLANIDVCSTGYGVGQTGYCSAGIIYVEGAFEERPEITIDNCTFAYNLTGSYSCPGCIHVYRGIVNVTNTIFHANAISSDNTKPADIYVRYDSQDPLGAQCHVSYSMFDSLGTNNIAAAEGAILTTNNVVAGNPLFVTTVEEFFGCIPSSAPSLPRMPLSRGALRFTNNSATLEKIKAFNVHLRGGRGYYDETTGEYVNSYIRDDASAALDGGAPDSPYSSERDCQAGGNGRRVNMGAYGNTPWSTMTMYPGSFFIIR